MALEDDDDDAFADDDIGDDEDGGSFADRDNVFTDGGPDDADEGPEGTFRERADVFSTPQSVPEPHANPLTTAAEEAREYQTPKANALVRAKKDGVLVARWLSGNANDFEVAYYLGKQRVEDWRKPTQDEFESLKAKGRWVKGGVRAPADGALAAVDAEDAQPSFFTRHKKKLVVGGVVGGLGLAWWLYRHFWAEDGDVEETR